MPPPPAEDEELVLVVGVPGDIETLDTCCANFIRAHEALELVYEPPVLHRTVEQNGALIGAAGDLLPHSFESWEAHPDGLTYTIKVRPGVTFDDGTEVTAETVRFMTERNLNTPGGANWLLRNIAFINDPPEVLDKYTLRFTSTEDDPWAMEHFSRNVENASGPYRIVSRTPDQEVVFEKRDNYYGDPPAYDKIIWKIIPSNAEARAAAEGGRHRRGDRPRHRGLRRSGGRRRRHRAAVPVQEPRLHGHGQQARPVRRQGRAPGRVLRRGLRRHPQQRLQGRGPASLRSHRPRLVLEPGRQHRLPA